MLKINYIGKNIKVTEALKQYVQDKFSKLERYFCEDISVKVVMCVEKTIHKVEITVWINDVVARAEESCENMYKSINLAIDKIDRNLKKNKIKIQDRTSIRINSNVDYHIEKVDNLLGEDLEDNFEILKRKYISAKPMTEEEAILQMNLLNHSFYIFKDISNIVMVVYKRKDNKYGIIEFY